MPIYSVVKFVIWLTAPRIKRQRLQLVRIFIADIIVGLLLTLVALLGLPHAHSHLSMLNTYLKLL